MLEKLTEYSILEQEPLVSLDRAITIHPEGKSWDEVVDRGRRDVWRNTLAQMPSNDLLLLEFGVWKGESLRFFAELNGSPNSRFYGFDSFEGLPEDWRGMAASRFDVGGILPEINDPRVKLVKGWFNETLPGMLDELEVAHSARTLVVHFDADVYSSTLYLLFALSQKFSNYYFIFDEFSGHELRAFYNYLQATGRSVKYLYRLDWKGCPQVVSGEILPAGER